LATTVRYGRKVDRALGVWVKLARAFWSFNKRAAEDIRRYKLTQPQFAVIEILGHLGPLTLGEISRKQLTSCSNVTVIIDNLEEEGLVVRSHSKSDRRVIHARLTAKGKKFFNQIFKLHARRIADLASVLSESEQDQLGRLLKKLGLGVQ
jgi:MarR family 2-MHQ and catechol resistance regulon transcriptional repressor